MSRQQLDARRLLCPMPVIKAQNQIASMQAGEELEIVCTDPGAMLDIPAWARIHGHEVVETIEENEEFIITVRVS